MLFIVEDDKVISEFMCLILGDKYDFELISFKDLQLKTEAIQLKKKEIVVDISRNPNYLLIVNRLKKLYGNLESVNFIVNSEQYKSLNRDRETADKITVIRSVGDLESFFNSKLNDFRRQL